MRLAAKRLSTVEVSAEASNQHEFHATALREFLEFPQGETRGELIITYVTTDESDPDVESGRFTLYNSREGQPRSPEYRLFYDSRSLQERAAAGDILILSRPTIDTTLRALIVPEASGLGRAVGAVLDAEGIELKERFKRIVGSLDRSTAAALLNAAGDTTSVPDPGDFLAVASPAFVEKAAADGRLPGTREMADEAGKIVSRLRRDRSDPDFDLQWSLDAETALFQHLERLIGQRWLDEHAARGALQIEDAMSFALSQLQSRKSRRGQSLQNHFARILDDRRIRYGAQCTTERRERPDFVFPGCREYKDPNFPSSRLRMVACKSVLRERWDQPLNEAARIPEKYLLTVDPGITADTIDRILGARLVLFLPRPMIAKSYRDVAVQAKLRDVRDLLACLENAAKADT